jgi:hypothetical protein
LGCVVSELLYQLYNKGEATVLQTVGWLQTRLQTVGFTRENSRFYKKEATVLQLVDSRLYKREVTVL